MANPKNRKGDITSTYILNAYCINKVRNCNREHWEQTPEYIATNLPNYTLNHKLEIREFEKIIKLQIT